MNTFSEGLHGCFGACDCDVEVRAIQAPTKIYYIFFSHLRQSKSFEFLKIVNSFCILHVEMRRRAEFMRKRKKRSCSSASVKHRHRVLGDGLVNRNFSGKVIFEVGSVECPEKLRNRFQNTDNLFCSHSFPWTSQTTENVKRRLFGAYVSANLGHKREINKKIASISRSLLIQFFSGFLSQ